MLRRHPSPGAYLPMPVTSGTTKNGRFHGSYPGGSDRPRRVVASPSSSHFPYIASVSQIAGGPLMISNPPLSSNSAEKSSTNPTLTGGNGSGGASQARVSSASDKTAFEDPIGKKKGFVNVYPGLLL